MTIAALKALCSRVPWCEPGVVESSLELALEIEATLIPELWLLDRHHTQLSAAAAGAIETQRLARAAHSLSEVGEES